MTTITSATQYSAYRYLATATTTSSTAGSSSGAGDNSSSSSGNSATSITLSSAALSAMGVKDYATVIAETRTALTKLLDDAEATSPLKDGKLAIDLSGLDRRALFAIASNAEGQFTDDERSAAAIELSNRFDAALTGPAAVARVTGDSSTLYKAALDFLDGASDEEKATDVWKTRKAATLEAQKQLAADPATLPDVANDPVADYLRRSETGKTGELRDFGDVATDVRAALDKQAADAKAAGKELVFSKFRKNGQQVDFSQFDSRSLSAIVLNKDDKFSVEEVNAAKSEIRTRSGQALLASFKSASSSGDPTAFALNLISAYSSLSAEERTAVGWTQSFYDNALANYQSSAKIAEMFASSTQSDSASSGFSGLASLLG